jgi:hypothetical protein
MMNAESGFASRFGRSNGFYIGVAGDTHRIIQLVIKICSLFLINGDFAFQLLDSAF